MSQTPKPLSREPRIFLPEDFTVKDWDTLKPYFQELLDGEITNAGQPTEKGKQLTVGKRQLSVSIIHTGTFNQ